VAGGVAGTVISPIVDIVDETVDASIALVNRRVACQQRGMATTKSPSGRGAAPAPAERPDAVSANEVAEWIRTRIRKGRLVSGQRLIEADVIRETGATRSRVREALQRLDGEGLVTIEEFRGASVRRLSREEVTAIYRARAVLEALAAAEFATQGGTAREALRAVQSDLDKAVAEGDHDAFARANDVWHGLIIAGCGNPYVIQFVERLRVPVSRLLFSSFHNRQRLDAANADHLAITEAILAGHGDEAEVLMRRHIEDGFAALTAQGLDE